MFEPWPDEPDETEAEARWGNPERDLPRVPEVSTDETDVDPHTSKTFWVSVVFANAAVFGVSLGAMLWFFRGQALLGGVLIFVGVLAALRTYMSYRAFDDRESEGTVEGDDGATTDTDDVADAGTVDADTADARDPAERNG